MGSEVQLERYMPGYSAMRELGEDVSSRAWNYYDRQFQGTAVGLYSEHDKDVLKQKMLEHDAVFRRQVSELHRLYRTQRDLMEEMKRSELYNHRNSLSSNPVVVDQRQDSSRWRSSVLPASNSACTSPSVLGAEHSSPNLSLLKGKTPKTDLFSAQDADDSNDCEIIECRPGKVRRKMFDLQLSADEYIDPDEAHQNGGVETPALAFHSSDAFHSVQSYLGVNGFAGEVVTNTTKVSTWGRSGGSSKGYGSGRGSNFMNDLNEPIQIEDDSPMLDFLNHRTSRNSLDTESLALRTPPKTYSRATSFISHYGQSGKPLLVDRENSKAKLPRTLGRFDTNESSLSQCLQPENYQEPSRLLHCRNGTSSYGASFPVLPDQSKEKFWKDTMMSGSKSLKGGHGPQIQSISHSLDELVNHWPRPMTSSEKYGGNSSVGLSKSSQASNQPPKVFGEKLNIAVEVPRFIDLDHGSSSGSKEESISYPSVNFKNLGSGSDGAAAPGCSGNLISHKYSKGLTIDLNCAEEMDLNATATDDAIHETALGQNLIASYRLEKSHHTTLLPWLKPTPKPLDFSQASSNPLVNKIEGRASDHCSKKINGFPVLSQPLTAGSFRLSKGQKSEIKQNRVFDTNLLCEAGTSTEAPAAEKTADTKITAFKNLFDLNSCVTDDEVSTISGYSAVKNGRGIDLEAPPPVDVEEDMNMIHGGDQSLRHPSAVVQQMQEEPELERVAAEAMISFCSLKEDEISERAAATETLKWFAGVVSSRQSGSDSEQKLNADAQPNEEPIMRTSSDKMDYFEHMTLNLPEMSAEDSFPKNAFLPIPNPEEEPASAFVSARPRRGQARRGRPKRDFQRDILPGLASLSRHEVTEDIQAFDGLMKAGGHAWQFGKRAAAARNKPRRGRPRTVNVAPVPSSSPRQPPPSCTEDVNLTGWGKTTRRPRRQRCPAGFLQPVRII